MLAKALAGLNAVVAFLIFVGSYWSVAQLVDDRIVRVFLGTTVGFILAIVTCGFIALLVDIRQLLIEIRDKLSGGM